MSGTAGPEIRGHSACSNRKARQTGATKFECMVIVVLAGVLATIFFDYLWRYQEQAEKSVMEATVTNMRSGLRLRVAELMTLDRMHETGSLLQENPIQWLETVPANYLGEMTNPEKSFLPDGSWYFDAGKRELVYIPRFTRFFEPNQQEEKVVRFKVTAASSQPSGTGDGKAEGLGIMLISQYEWF